jgi:hypothetical protein
MLTSSHRPSELGDIVSSPKPKKIITWRDD